jgi:hypothetical protein
VWLSNAFPTDGKNAGRVATPAADTDFRSAAVFSSYCRLNHACTPNVHGCWNASRGRQTMFAVRDIRVGEELCVSYLGDTCQPRAARQSSLESDFGFLCACGLCSMGGEALKRSDERRSRIRAIKGEMKEVLGAKGLLAHAQAALGGGVDMDGLVKARASNMGAAQVAALRRMREERLSHGIKLVEERLKLLRAEGEAAFSWDTLEAASRHCLAMGDKPRSMDYGRRGAEVARAALGTQSEEYGRCERLGRGVADAVG